MIDAASLYLPGDSFLHRLHPLTKLTFSLASAAIIFGGPGEWLPAILPGLFALVILARAGLGRRAIGMIVRLLALLAGALFIVHGLFNPHNHTILFRLGAFAVGREGLVFAALIVTRLASTLAASQLLVLSTHPSRLIQSLAEAGLPHGLAYLLGSPLLLLPQMAKRVQAIRVAQQARGLETQGNIIRRARGLFPLVAPLVFGALMDVEERSLALEARGFSAPNPKTYLFELEDTAGQRVGRWFMILLVIILLLAGLL